MRFGIVIPNLNQSQFLKTGLQSLRHQNVSFNLAIMDGGSTDGFENVCHGFHDIISFSRSQPDKGQADAIHEGKRKVKGDILAWLNADDYYFPGALDKVAALFAANPAVDVIYGDAVHVDGQGRFLSYFPAVREHSAAELTKNCYICQPACFYRRKIYERSGGIDRGLHYTMDWDLWCKMARTGARFMYLPAPLAAVRYYAGTKTLCGSRRRYQEIYAVEKKYGTRRLPVYFLGAYLYSLGQNAPSPAIGRIARRLFKAKKSLKNTIHAFRNNGGGISDDTLYGFNRWEPIVDKRCEIHIPWYDSLPWQKLQLGVDPIDDRYTVWINNIECNVGLKHNGAIIVETPDLNDPYRLIEIKNETRTNWRFTGFDIES